MKLQRHAPGIVPVSRASYFYAALIFVFFLLRYVVSLTDVHTFDALSYVLDVDRKPWTEMFHPHHLAYGPLGALSLTIARAFGYTGTAAEPLQIVNALAGAFGIAAFFLVTKRLTYRTDAALIAALLLGGSYAYWYYAVEVEVYTVAVCFLILCLALLIRLIRQPTVGTWIALGIVQTLAVLFHQTNVLLSVPALIVWLIPFTRGRKSVSTTIWQQAFPFVLYVLTVGSLVALSYGLVGLISGFRSWEQFSWWMTSYARTGWWGGPINETKWEKLGQGLSETLAQPGGALLALLLVGLGVAHGRALVVRYWRLMIVLISWLLAYGIFFLWWEPDNIEFWIASLPPVLLLLALALTNTQPWRAATWIGVMIAATTLAVNGDSIAWRGSATNDTERHVTTLLAKRTTSADLLLVPDGMQELYLPYYAERYNYLSLNQALFESRGDVADGVPLSEAQGQPYWRETCATIQGRIERTLASGAQVVIGEQVMHPPALLLQRHQLTQQQVDDCFARYAAYLMPMTFPAPLPVYWRLPTAQEIANGSGWDFTQDSWGWQPVNMETVAFEGGWVLQPGDDGRIESPLLQIDTSRFSAIEIRLAYSTRNREAQLFFGDAQGLMEDARSIQWKYDRTDETRTYRIELRGQPGWTGTVTRLRFDPVAKGGEGSVKIESIRLLP